MNTKCVRFFRASDRNKSLNARRKLIKNERRGDPRNLYSERRHKRTYPLWIVHEDEATDRNEYVQSRENDH